MSAVTFLLKDVGQRTAERIVPDVSCFFVEVVEQMEVVVRRIRQQTQINSVSLVLPDTWDHIFDIGAGVLRIHPEQELVLSRFDQLRLTGVVFVTNL